MEFNKGWMTDSMFGKTVSELTDERRKRNMDIISDILYGKGADPKTQLADAVGAPLGIMFAKWAKSKMGDGKDSVLESARGVEAKQNELTELLKTTDYTNQEQVTKLANIYYENGDEATGRAYTNMARSISRQGNADSFYDNYTKDQLELQLLIAKEEGNFKQYEVIGKALDRKDEKIGAAQNGSAGTGGTDASTENPQGRYLNTYDNMEESAKNNNNNNQTLSVVVKKEVDGVTGATAKADATTGASAKKKRTPTLSDLIYK